MTSELMLSYQLLILNRADVEIQELLQACNDLQAMCNEETCDIQHIKLLEKLLLAYYEKLYPKTFGGIFE